MRTTKRCAKTIFIPLVIMMLFSSSFTGILYSGMNDKTDRLSNDQAGIFSPGYINAAKQKTEAIINQSSKQKSLMENITDYVKNKLSGKVNEGALDKPAPELKKKSSAIGENAQEAAASSAETGIADATLNYNVNIGSGTNQVRENGRLISEVINGKRYVYAGFDRVGKSSIRDAIDIALAGDTVVVKAGRYPYSANTSTTIALKDGVSLYGGYSESGVRDIRNTPTEVGGSISAYGISRPTEINGIIVNYMRHGDGIQVRSANNLIIVNNTFYGTESNYGISIYNSKIQVINNNFYYTEGRQKRFVPRRRRMRPTGGEPSTVLSKGNNFFGDGYGLSLGESRSVVESKNDYFARSAKGHFVGSSNVAIVNPATNPVTQTTISLAKNTASTLDSRTISHYRTKLDEYNRFQDMLLTTRSGKELDANTIASIFKGLIKGKEGILASNMGLQGTSQVEAIVLNALKEGALSVPIANIKESNREEMEVALILADIIKNPTEDQKVVLGATTALLNEVNKQEQESASPELTKASDGFLQMVASVLIAQAIPDLFKEGDVASIKNIFSELNTQKGRIILEYQDSVKPYYEEIAKELSNNMNILQLKNILSGNMAKEQLEKLPPNELDKILEKLRQAKDKSLEEEHILRQEAKYRSLYIEPNKKMLEDNMKHMLEGFTKKLSGALEEVKKVEKK